MSEEIKDVIDALGKSFEEFKSETIVNAPAQVVYEVVKDVKSFPKWFGFCKDIKVTKTHSALHKSVFVVIDTPWPVTDRYAFTDVKYITKKADSPIKVDIPIVSEKDPASYKDDDYVRMTIKAMCSITELGQNKTKVVYSVNADPGGSIPSGIAGMFMKRQPFYTLRGLKKMAKNKKYYKLAGIEK